MAVTLLERLDRAYILARGPERVLVNDATHRELRHELLRLADPIAPMRPATGPMMFLGLPVVPSLGRCKTAFMFEPR